MKFMKIAIAAVCLAASTPAAADDTKKVTAGGCQKIGSAGSLVISHNKIGNSSTTQSMVIDCPVIRDDDLMIDWWFQALVQNSSLGITCTMFSVNDAFASMTVKQVSASTASGTGWRKVSSSASALAGTPYFMSCTLPPATSTGTSWLASYGWAETDSTGTEY